MIFEVILRERELFEIQVNDIILPWLADGVPMSPFLGYTCFISSEKSLYKHKKDIIWSSMTFEVILQVMKKLGLYNVSIHRIFFLSESVIKLMLNRD